MISVAMTTYNGEKYISKQLESILAQTVPVDEIIIFDDGSTDNTAQIISQLNNPKIKFFVNDHNVGYIKNFYKAISRCSGDFIFLSDQDDIWVSNKVERMVRIMEDTGTDALCTNFSLINADGQEIDRESFPQNRFFRDIKGNVNLLISIEFEYIVYGNIIQGATFCINKTVQKYYKELNNELVYHDHQLLLIASKIGKVIFLNEPLIQYRIHSNNTIGLKKKKSKLLKELKIPKIEPSMVTFLKQLNRVSKVQHYFYYILYYYLRIPSIKNIIKILK